MSEAENTEHTESRGVPSRTKPEASEGEKTSSKPEEEEEHPPSPAAGRALGGGTARGGAAGVGTSAT